jgi:hypothetical protein
MNLNMREEKKIKGKKRKEKQCGLQWVVETLVDRASHMIGHSTMYRPSLESAL